MSDPRQPLDLALLWHMHQPSYRDPISGQIALPWVRLHSTRAYFDMAWLLERHPEIKATFNFVPILLEQLESYVERGERDRYWELSYKPASELTANECALVVRHFFSVHLETGIKPRARYWSLFRRFKEEGQDPQSIDESDLRDLQVLFNLAWFGYGTRVEFPLIDELDRKGQNYTEEDKKNLLDLQIEVMRRLLPMYRKLAERNQIELTSTPYYHPILPLILDSDVARRCQPDRPRPPRFSWPEDAKTHVQRAIEAHQRAFGMPPAGMWPAEGSVSPEVAALLAQCGVKWIASDEAQLWNSYKGCNLPRHELFHAYNVEHEGQTISMIFRDRGISDALGFTYSRNPASVSVDDFMRNARAIRDSLPQNGERGLLVVALDGENPWEYYEASGRLFLECLYDALKKDQSIRTVRVGDHLRENPPVRKIEHLHTGSWINSDFGIWIGGSVENRAWKRLGEARQFFEEARHDLSPETCAKAYEHLLQAEGSDWFWWYGEPFHSENDEEFDYLFRSHLRQVYTLCGVEPPPVLDRSLYPPKDAAAARLPSFFVTPRFGGDRPSTYFDWLGAGCYELANACSSMYQAAKYLDKFLYGFDLKNLYLRLEALTDLTAEAEELTLRVRLYAAQDYCAEIPLHQLSKATLYRIAEDQKPCDPEPLTMVQMRSGIIELGIPFEKLGLHTGDVLRFSAHLLRNRVELEAVPMGELAQVTVPTPAFEEIRQWP